MGYEEQELRELVISQQEIQRADRALNREAKKVRGRGREGQPRQRPRRSVEEGQSQRGGPEGVEAEADKARAEAETETFRVEVRLPMFRDGVPFILRTESSDTGLRAVLLQEFEGEDVFCCLPK